MNSIIETTDLSRSFGAVLALNGLSLHVHEGEVFGMLGPNGAGKTTTVRLLNGVLSPSRGKARVLGLDPVTQGSALRQRTGVLTETPSLYERLTARENLTIFAKLYSVPAAQVAARVNEQLELFDLTARADDRAGGFSKGMKQRLALARALLHQPELLFLDEPTAGLDPEAARHVTQMIQQLSHQKGRSVFLCTHNLDEAQRLCDRVAVMNRGSLLACGTLDELSRTLWHGQWVDIGFRAAPSADQLHGLRELRGVTELHAEGAELAARVESNDVIPALVQALAARGAQIMRVNPRNHTLEEVYFELQEQQK
jgi:ABC-2 type transport system ATP-binding protein